MCYSGNILLTVQKMRKITLVWTRLCTKKNIWVKISWSRNVLVPKHPGTRTSCAKSSTPYRVGAKNLQRKKLSALKRLDDKMFTPKRQRQNVFAKKKKHIGAKTARTEPFQRQKLIGGKTSWNTLSTPHFKINKLLFITSLAKQLFSNKSIQCLNTFVYTNHVDWCRIFFCIDYENET